MKHDVLTHQHREDRMYDDWIAAIIAGAALVVAVLGGCIDTGDEADE